MNVNPLLLDGLIAAAVAAVVLIVAPGVAIAGMLAVLVLALCGGSLLWDRRRASRASRAPRVRRRLR